MGLTALSPPPARSPNTFARTPAGSKTLQKAVNTPQSIVEAGEGISEVLQASRPQHQWQSEIAVCAWAPAPSTRHSALRPRCPLEGLAGAVQGPKYGLQTLATPVSLNMCVPSPAA